MPTSHTNNNPDIDKFIQLGMRLSVSLQFGPGDSYEFTTTLTGYKSEQYLILELPQKALELLIMRKLSNIETVIRGICNKDYGHIIAFKTSSYQSVRRPFNLLFLRPPQHFASKKIRQYERYEITEPTRLKTLDKEVSGPMIDFSASGCGIFISGENELTVGEKIELEVEGRLNNLLPNTISSHIVKITRKPKGHAIGVKFDQIIDMSDALRKEVLELAFLNGSI